MKSAVSDGDEDQGAEEVRSWGQGNRFSSVLEAVSRVIERLSFQRGRAP